MNKKNLMLFGLPIAIGLVAAALTYYALATVTLNVNQPIDVSGALEQPVDCDAGDTCLGAAITISNSDDEDRVVTLSDNSENYPNVINDMSYVGKMHFTQKNLNTWVSYGNSADIEYTITGNSFVVSGIPAEYTLIYYPNTVDDVFANNVAGIIVLSEGVNEIGDLPISSDVGDDYCNIGGDPKFNPYALVCNGAKLWLVPTTALSGLQSGSWSDANTFLFETDLITYMDSTDGEVLVPAKSTITIYPQFEVNKYASDGDRTIQITIA